jgi:uncharacterized SAM-binding protein YcdF (DUF218 family)
VAGGALLAVVAYTPAVVEPARSLVRSDPPAAPVEAVVVLSGRVTPDGYVDPVVVDRLLTGLEVVRAERVPTLILSRVRFVRPGHVRDSDADQRRLVALATPSVALHVVDSVYATRDEAVRTWALARRLGVHRIALVTSPIHTRRACATFERVGFSVRCVPAADRDAAIRDLHEAGDRVRAFRQWLYESLGILAYRARGWL